MGSKRKRKGHEKHVRELNQAPEILREPSGKRDRPKKKPKGKSPRDLSYVLAGGGGSSLPYMGAWTDTRYEQVKAFKHWTYVAIDRIARRFASKMPNVSTIKIKDGKEYTDQTAAARNQRFKAFHERRRVLAPLLQHEALQPVDEGHPLVQLLRDPNDPDTSWTLWYETLQFLLLTGNAYWLLPDNGLGIGIPEAIWCLPSHWVWPVFGNRGLIEAYELRPVEGNYLRLRLPVEDVIHFRFPSPISKIDGYSPLTAGAEWSDVQTSINRARGATYRNGTFPTIAIQFDSQLIDPSPEQLRRIEERFASRFVGEIKSNRPMFLPPGVKVVPLSITPNQMVFGETAKETRDNILALFGVPPIVAGLMDGPPGLVQAAKAEFCTGIINTLYEFFGQTLTEKLCPRYDDDGLLRVWWEDSSPDDFALLEQQIKTDLVAGAITPNEIRIMRGREPWPDEWADKPLMPVNMQPGALPGGGEHFNQPGDKLSNPDPEQPRVSEGGD